MSDHDPSLWRSVFGDLAPAVLKPYFGELGAGPAAAPRSSTNS